MNRFLALGCVGLGLAVSPLLGGSARSAVPAVTRVGVVDLNSIVSTPAGKRADQQFEKNRKTKQGELDRKQDELKRQANQLEAQKSVMGPDVFKQRRDELEKKIVELQQTYTKLERELATDRTKLMRGLMDQAKPHIERIARAEGVTVVIDENVVVWSDPAVNLTQKVTAELK